MTIIVFLAGLALGWLAGIISGLAWALWALRRKGDYLRRLREGR